MSQHEQQRSGSVQAEADRLKRDADVTAQRAQGEARNIAAEAKGAARDVADEARGIGSSVKSEALSEPKNSGALSRNSFVASTADT